MVNLWLKNKLKTAVALYGARLGPLRGACPTRTWVINKAFELMLQIPKEIIDASWRKVNLEHPMTNQDFIFEEEDDEEFDAENGEFEGGDGAQLEEEMLVAEINWEEVGAENENYGGAQIEEIDEEMEEEWNMDIGQEEIQEIEDLED
ncbi:Oidioi.mRNA.OKI2018_I69.YSR.g17058.t1.cds [Oikopleura dioica]|uniref:Oidioi.mRNA.OKI2018_I69.YSR.g17058.t1.cds n=1 Tax=Oikopleura dioica TaxID=34765 RepID=A0ABN7SI35_OIKDI|nr:Oidioi.mRNA.OKI2018_I69.YSR.g17058.t1.cds [Oikopleura dioica]